MMQRGGRMLTAWSGAIYSVQPEFKPVENRVGQSKALC